MTARALRWLADKIDRTTAEVEIEDRTGPIPGARSAFRDDDSRTLRNETAFRLLDDDTLGYVVFRIHRDLGGGGAGQVSLDAQVDMNAWPAVRSTMARAVLASDQVVSHRVP